jgi:hypothetical protein
VYIANMRVCVFARVRTYVCVHACMRACVINWLCALAVYTSLSTDGCAHSDISWKVSCSIKCTCQVGAESNHVASLRAMT